MIPLAMQQYVLLECNLVYTGITRGKKLVVLAGEGKALSIAIKRTMHTRAILAYSAGCGNLQARPLFPQQVFGVLRGIMWNITKVVCTVRTILTSTTITNPPKSVPICAGNQDQILRSLSRA
jgi:hypothetical protein